MGWNKGTSKLLGTADEHHGQKRTKDDLGYNESIGEADARFDTWSRSISDDVPCCSWKSFVEHFDDDADVGVHIRRDYLARNDVSHPQFAQGAVKSGQ